MSVFSKLKNKIVGRREPVEERDFESVRSAILGESASPVGPKQEIQPAWKTKYAESTVPREFAQPSLEEPMQSMEIRQPYAQAFGEKPEEKNKWDRKDVYELFDRLGVMEAQLAAIRSQTETINERLKMLEIRITRRY